MNKENIKVVFFGTSDRSVPILESLSENFDLVLCVTKSDSKVGRKQKHKETGVKTWAKKHYIPFVEIENFKEPFLTKLLEQIRYSKAEYGVVADFSLIIPVDVIKYFQRRLINIHFSLLPKYRGASPIQFAILNGDDNIGISFHLVHEKLDRGGILAQVGYNMSGIETSGELYEALFDIASQKLPRILREYADKSIKSVDQDENNATYTFSPSHPKSTHIFKEDARIDWKKGATQIEREIRAFNPWPISWTYLKDLEKVNYLDEGKISLKSHIDADLIVKIYSAGLNKENEKDPKLKITELQVEGKRKMSWDDFKNGYLES